MHSVCLCPLYDLGMAFKSMLSLDNGIYYGFILVWICLVGGFSLHANWQI